jgi:hypothetical protein
MGRRRAAGFVELFVNVHAWRDRSGAIAIREGHALDLLRRRRLPGGLGLLTLSRRSGASSATVFFVADLGAVLARWGNRGYRVANLEAGLVGGGSIWPPRAGLATGLTF